MEAPAVILISFAKLSPDELSMITRKSFFIRWLTISNDDKPQDKHSVIDVEHIQSGASQRVSSPEEANLWMREIDAEDMGKSKESESG